MKTSKKLGVIGYLKLYCRKGLSKTCFQDFTAEFFEATITQASIRDISFTGISSFLQLKNASKNIPVNN